MFESNVKGRVRMYVQSDSGTHTVRLLRRNNLKKLQKKKKEYYYFEQLELFDSSSRLTSIPWTAHTDASPCRAKHQGYGL